MSREKTYRIEVRQAGEPWRKVWSGVGLKVALDAAHGLALKTREYPGGLRIPVHPRVRVLQGKQTVLDLDFAASSRRVA
jgi:hypothetical protein